MTEILVHKYNLEYEMAIRREDAKLNTSTWNVVTIYIY